MKKVVHLLLVSVIALLASGCESDTADPHVICDGLRITAGTFSENDDLILSVTNEMGSQYTIADWNDIKEIDNIPDWISCINLRAGQNFMVARNGDFRWEEDQERQYFVQYFADGDVPSTWLVHDQINNMLFLGSWYDLDMRIMAKRVSD